MYGPQIPNMFAIIIPIEIPDCRRHVGYVSNACKLIAKYVMFTQNFAKTVKQIVNVLYSASKWQSN